MSRRKQKIWTPDEEAVLVSLWVRGSSSVELAEHFGRSKKAVAGKAYKMGLARRYATGPTPITSWRDPRIIDRARDFLVVYADCRNIGPALAEVKIGHLTYCKLRQQDHEFAQRVALVEARFQDTIKCTVCDKTGTSGDFSKRMNTEKNLGVCRPCQTERVRVYTNTLRGRLSSVLLGAKNRHKGLYGFKERTFGLSLDYLEDKYNAQRGRCYYTGRPMVYATEANETRHFRLVSLDRKNSKLGYTKRNTVLCCWGVNAMKRSLSYRRFLALCGQVAKTHKDFGRGGTDG